MGPDGLAIEGAGPRNGEFGTHGRRICSIGHAMIPNKKGQPGAPEAVLYNPPG
jgi:hypothetical protein